MMHSLMDSFIFLIILCLVPTGSSRVLSRRSPSNIYDVVTYGAVGDGKTDDTQGFFKAWKAVCSAQCDSPTLLVPAGKTFLLYQVAFKGPCKSRNVHVSISGNIVAPGRSGWRGDKDHWLQFSNVAGLVVDGRGELDGLGADWWGCAKGHNVILKLDGCERPTSLNFNRCNNLRLSGITSINSASNHISINKCNGATISDINLTAPEDSPNTDGIDISESTNIQIQHSTIGTGDDCVAINSGSSFINISNIACGPGHGISVGSLGKNGENSMVEEVHVTNCNLTRTTNGARIKTWQGGSGYARKISFQDITLTDVKNPIIINQNYCQDGNCRNKKTGSENVQISDITYSGFRGTSAEQEAITLKCSKNVPCTNINLNEVNIRSESGDMTTSTCANAEGTATSTIPPVKCLEV